MSKTMQLKAKINTLAKENKISAQAVLQNYMLERLLERIAHSKYQGKVIVKGGMLIVHWLESTVGQRWIWMQPYEGFR